VFQRFVSWCALMTVVPGAFEMANLWACHSPGGRGLDPGTSGRRDIRPAEARGEQSGKVSCIPFHLEADGGTCNNFSSGFCSSGGECSLTDSESCSVGADSTQEHASASGKCGDGLHTVDGKLEPSEVEETMQVWIRTTQFIRRLTLSGGSHLLGFPVEKRLQAQTNLTYVRYCHSDCGKPCESHGALAIFPFNVLLARTSASLCNCLIGVWC
jgi:hypothetical protein